MTNAVTGLFAYGTLMATDIMRRACRHEGPSTPARLRNYFRGTILDETYPGIVSATGANVTGLYYPDLTRSAIGRLDEFEGEMYERITVDVETASGLVSAQTYVIRPCFRHMVTSVPWAFDAFMRSGYRGFIAAYGGFCAGEGID